MYLCIYLCVCMCKHTCVYICVHTDTYTHALSWLFCVLLYMLSYHIINTHTCLSPPRHTGPAGICSLGASQVSSDQGTPGPAAPPSILGWNRANPAGRGCRTDKQHPYGHSPGPPRPGGQEGFGVQGLRSFSLWKPHFAFFLSSKAYLKFFFIGCLIKGRGWGFFMYLQFCFCINYVAFNQRTTVNGRLSLPASHISAFFF